MVFRELKFGKDVWDQIDNTKNSYNQTAKSGLITCGLLYAKKTINWL